MQLIQFLRGVDDWRKAGDGRAGNLLRLTTLSPKAPQVDPLRTKVNATPNVLFFIGILPSRINLLKDNNLLNLKIRSACRRIQKRPISYLRFTDKSTML